MLESQIQRQIIEYLKVKQIWHRRFNSGVAKMGGRWVHFGSPGLPDILARPANKNALYWIEVKQPGKYLTPEQKRWKEESEAFGDTFILARCVEDVMAVL